MKNLVNFLNSGAGLLILGFLVTTGGGSILTYLIQTLNSNNERRFQMYKTRLEEAKALQKVFLENSTARVFYLNQIWLMLGDSSETREDIKKYWQEKVTGTKDDWNKNLVYWQAQLRVLFNGDLDDLLENDEENLTREPSAPNNLNEHVYNKGIPQTLHGAFVDTHRTLHYIVFELQDRDDCKWQGLEHCQVWKDLIALANKQIKHLKLLHSCLSYRISGGLLVDPYGPHAGFAGRSNAQIGGIDSSLRQNGTAKHATLSGLRLGRDGGVFASPEISAFTLRATFESDRRGQLGLPTNIAAALPRAPVFGHVP